MLMALFLLKAFFALSSVSLVAAVQVAQDFKCRAVGLLPNGRNTVLLLLCPFSILCVVVALDFLVLLPMPLVHLPLFAAVVFLELRHEFGVLMDGHNPRGIVRV